MRNHCFCKYRPGGGSGEINSKIDSSRAPVFHCFNPPFYVLYHSGIRSNINKYFFCNVFTVCWAFLSKIHCILQSAVIGFFHCVVLVSLDLGRLVFYTAGAVLSTSCTRIMATYCFPALRKNHRVTATCSRNSPLKL